MSKPDREAFVEQLRQILASIPEVDTLVAIHMEGAARAQRTSELFGMPPYGHRVVNAIIDWRVETLGPIEALSMGMRDRPKVDVPLARKFYRALRSEGAFVCECVGAEPIA